MENFVAVRNILECVFKTFKKKIKNIQPRPRGGGERQAKGISGRKVKQIFILRLPFNQIRLLMCKL